MKMKTRSGEYRQETPQELRDKEYYIAPIDVMDGLTQDEIQRLRSLDIRKVSFEYKMKISRKTQEQLS